MNEESHFIDCMLAHWKVSQTKVIASFGEGPEYLIVVKPGCHGAIGENQSSWDEELLSRCSNLQPICQVASPAPCVGVKCEHKQTTAVVKATATLN